MQLRLNKSFAADTHRQGAARRVDKPTPCGALPVRGGQLRRAAPGENRVLLRSNFYVITGASGGGKSTLVAALSELGYSTVHEAALAVLREQQECGGTALPSVDRAAFFEEVLTRNISNHQAAQTMRAQSSSIAAYQNASLGCSCRA
ncbi:MAG TPA: AAA family ATPase [Ramlibacter sp.]|uniref:AAA family ATPase n=1 Tax=Ramlibacter sp. TaxID=1917967 RepID=UPI002D5B7559|nr:AAA family ATPase [Ramlibacter sp.]HZY17531.1 AAA family ATPase [Ramlibacter sp.]